MILSPTRRQQPSDTERRTSLTERVTVIETVGPSGEIHPLLGAQGWVVDGLLDFSYIGRLYDVRRGKTQLVDWSVTFRKPCSFRIDARLSIDSNNLTRSMVDVIGTTTDPFDPLLRDEIAREMCALVRAMYTR